MDELDSLPVRVEPMTISDLAEVLNIERLAYPSPWSARAYEYELRYNEMAHYFVARTNEATSNGSHNKPFDWLKRMFRPAPTASPPILVGYVGYWLMAGEAHISTIAVHPQFRGRGYGELLLVSTLEDAAKRGSHVATLEVRVSNSSAQQLYTKYGFEKVGLRKAYYSDNNEDAFIMTTPPLGAGQYQTKLLRLKAALELRLRERQSSPQLRTA